MGITFAPLWSRKIVSRTVTVEECLFPTFHWYSCTNMLMGSSHGDMCRWHRALTFELSHPKGIVINLNDPPLGYISKTGKIRSSLDSAGLVWDYLGCQKVSDSHWWPASLHLSELSHKHRYCHRGGPPTSTMSVSDISLPRGILINIVFLLPKEEPHHDPGFHAAREGWVVFYSHDTL